MRAAAVAERAGISSVSLVCSGFAGQASSTAAGLGFTHMQAAVMPGHVNMQTYEELKNNILDVTVENVVKGLTEEPGASPDAAAEPKPRDIVLRRQLRGSKRFLLRAGMERRASDRAAHYREGPTIPAFHRSAPRGSARRTLMRPARGHHLEYRGQRRDGGMPPRIHADTDR